MAVRDGNHQNSEVDSPTFLPKVDLYGEAALPVMRPQVNSSGFSANLLTFGKQSFNPSQTELGIRNKLQGLLEIKDTHRPRVLR